MKRAKKILMYTAGVLLILYLAVVAYRVPHFYNQDKAAAAVERIHATKLTMADVTGENLPPAPQDADATVAGVDANENGIRDDVELAIFERYPDEPKVRAALLQYALALQMEFTQDFVNSDVVIAVAQERGQAALCIGEQIPNEDVDEFIEKSFEYDEFLESLHLNTPERIEVQKEFYSHLDSFSDLPGACDVDLNTP